MVQLTLWVVLLIGLEPIRCCHRGILSPLRLPIPPQKQIYLICSPFPFLIVIFKNARDIGFPKIAVQRDFWEEER